MGITGVGTKSSSRVVYNDSKSAIGVWFELSYGLKWEASLSCAHYGLKALNVNNLITIMG